MPPIYTGPPQFEKLAERFGIKGPTWFDANHPDVTGPGHYAKNANPMDPATRALVDSPAPTATDTPALPPLWNQNFAYEDFTPPTAASVSADPGNQYALAQAKQAAERGAASHGTLLTGGFLKALNRDQMGLASTQYQNVYNRDLNTYSANRGNALDAFNISRSIGDAQWDRSFSLANANNANALAYAQLYGNNLLTAAGAQGAGLTGAANANAAGTVAGANGWNSALSGIGGSAQQLALLQSMGYLNNTGSQAMPTWFNPSSAFTGVKF